MYKLLLVSHGLRYEMGVGNKLRMLEMQHLWQRINPDAVYVIEEVAA